MHRDSETEVLKHFVKCWGKDGPGFKVAEDVAELKSWTKGIGIAIVLLQLLSAGSTIAKWATPTVPAAQACETQH